MNRLKAILLAALAVSATAATCVLQYNINCVGYSTSLKLERYPGQWEWADGTVYGSTSYVDCWGLGGMQQASNSSYTCVLCGPFYYRSDQAPAGTNCVNQTKSRQNCSVPCGTSGT